MNTKNDTKKVNKIIDQFIVNLNSSGMSFAAISEQCKMVQSIVLRYGTNAKGIKKLSKAIQQLNNYNHNNI